MTSKDQQVRATIGEQAGEWFVANDEASLAAGESAQLVAWLKASPAHIEEFLGVASVARDLHAAGADPEFSVESLLARAQADSPEPLRPSWHGAFTEAGNAAARRGPSAALTLAVASVAALGVLLWWNLTRTAPLPATAAAEALHFSTRHGEQQSVRLPDASILHLNTDSAVSVRYSEAERLVVLTAGEADFEVTHEPTRAFRVLAGPAAVFDLGTRFDVRLTPDATVVTVVEGRVAVEPAPAPGTGGTNFRIRPAARSVQLAANQQISVAEGQWPAAPVTVDAQRATAWLHRQIAFEHEPLERVVAELNRYTSKPIEITAPALRRLEVSGVFSTDDTEEFLAFLRSLEGVRVEVTATQILVSQK